MKELSRNVIDHPYDLNLGKLGNFGRQNGCEKGSEDLNYISILVFRRRNFDL